MNEALQQYIKRIQNNDVILDSIQLFSQNLNDTDVALLITALTENPVAASRITNLNLGVNKLTALNLPDTLTALEYLDLKNNQLTALNLPDTLTALEYLDLDNNQLTALNLPDTLTALEDLVLYNNQLTALNLPDTLTALEYLNLYNNQLTALNLPDTLTALEYLDLDNNQLTALNLPDTLTALERLNLGKNQLTALNLPDTLTALEYLNLKNNQLTALNLPDTLTALEHLNLENNQLTALNLPDTLTALEHLNLKDNQLTALNLPDTLTALEELNLENNQLTALNLPDTLTALQYLHLENNQLTALNLMWPIISNIDYINLTNNPLTDATKIALNAEKFFIEEGNYNLDLFLDNPLEGEATLTREILDEHFQSILRRPSSDEMFDFFKKNSCAFLLSYLTKEQTLTICEYNDCFLQINRARASMTYLLTGLGDLAVVKARKAEGHTFNQQITLLHEYNGVNGRLNQLINQLNIHYLEALRGQAINNVAERIKRARANTTAAALQPISPLTMPASPLLWSYLEFSDNDASLDSEDLFQEQTTKQITAKRYKPA